MSRFNINPCKVCGSRAKMLYRKPITFICCKSKDCKNTTVSVCDSFDYKDSLEQCVKEWNEQNPLTDSNN